MFVVSSRELLILRAKTRKGQNRLTQFGTEWLVRETRDRVLFSSEPGPWLLIAETSHVGIHAPGSRWIHRTHDPDFEIVSSHVPQ